MRGNQADHIKVIRQCTSNDFSRNDLLYGIQGDPSPRSEYYGGNENNGDQVSRNHHQRNKTGKNEMEIRLGSVFQGRNPAMP